MYLKIIINTKVTQRCDAFKIEKNVLFNIVTEIFKKNHKTNQ